MKTYPLYDQSQKLVGFEITSAWIMFWPLFKVLKSVSGVSDIKRQWFNDDRIIFKYHGIDAVVNEPWGDNSRYWVGLKDPSAYPNIDISPIENAFKDYQGFTILYRRSKDKGHGL